MHIPGGVSTRELIDESTLYLGDSVQAAAAETLFRDLVYSDGLTGYHVPLAKLKGRHLSSIEVRRPLRLVRLTGPGAVAIGQPDSWITLCDGSLYPATREWAKEFLNGTLKSLDSSGDPAGTRIVTRMCSMGVGVPLTR